MARIIIARVRTNHELAWRIPPALRTAARALRLGYVDRVLNGIDGKPFLAQMTTYYLAALGERAARARGAGHTFEVVEGPEESFAIPDGADVVLFTVNTPAAPATYRIADGLRARGIPVVLGGIHVTMLPAEAALHADGIATGEGEAVIDELLDDLEHAGRPRPVYRGGRIESLAGLPLPRWPHPSEADVCPWVIPLQTSRGCRNACSFCSTTRHQGAQRRHRPVEDIIAEIRACRESGLFNPDKAFFLTDNNSVSDSDHRRGLRDTTYAKSLFRALRPLSVTWTGQGEISVADDPELVDLLAAAGCRTLLVGFESLDQHNLGAVGKVGNHVEDYIRRIEVLHRHGIQLIGCFILGLDNDTTDVFDRTADFVQRYIDIPQISVLTPFPGTAQFARMEREGRILHKDWSRYDISHVVYRPLRMSPEELELGYRRTMEKVFSWTRMLVRSTRRAFHPLDPGAPRVSAHSKWLSTLAPNLVYGSLGWVEPEDSASAAVRTARPASVRPPAEEAA
ncbi:MAG: B12-binding domain-containing radical SAM protein [Deltaproteobacteria bacterium]|nr:B12-binding domain-containing radical SAM protein [Deltaproteobacteria bacterium]